MAGVWDEAVPGTAAPIIPAPQTHALEPAPEVNGQNDEQDALQGVVPSINQKIAQNTVLAGHVNNGSPRDWAENAIAGVQSALAGFGAGGQIPKGSGGLYGVGAAARQAQERTDKIKSQKEEREFRQQELDLEKQRMVNEQNNSNRDYDLKLAENARQQAESVKRLALDDADLVRMNDEHSAANFQAMANHVKFMRDQVDYEESLKSAGAKPLKIAGKEVPGFDDLGKLEDFANSNQLAQSAHDNGYRTRPVYGADGKYHLYEVPDDAPEWHDVKGPDGKKTKIFTDSIGVLNYADKVAQTREANSRATLTYAEAQRQLNDLKDEGTIKKARADLSKVNGDYSKLPEGDKEALTGDAQKRYQLTFNAYQAAQNDLKKDADFANIPTDAKGNVDTNSAEYKALAEKYHLEDANEQLADAYDTLRKLGHGYQKPGASEAAASATTGAAAADAKSPEGAVDALKRKQAEDAAGQAKASDRAAQVNRLTAMTTQTKNPVTGQTNPDYNKDLADLIKAHPDWTEDQKIEAMNRLSGGAQGGGEPAGALGQVKGSDGQMYWYGANQSILGRVQ